MAKSDIYLANENVSIFDVCRLIGMPDMEYGYAASPKLYCPFGHVSHIDGGEAKSFRIYPDSNSAYCFACSQYFTPVSLLAMENDTSEEDAAAYLLEYFEVARETVEDKWNQLTADAGFQVNAADLAESLKLYCARIDPGWETHQFEEEVARVFQACLSLIPRIKSPDEVSEWRSAAKTAMKKRLDSHGYTTDAEQEHSRSGGVDNFA